MFVLSKIISSFESYYEEGLFVSDSQDKLLELQNKYEVFIDILKNAKDARRKFIKQFTDRMNGKEYMTKYKEIERQANDIEKDFVNNEVAKNNISIDELLYFKEENKDLNVCFEIKEIQKI